jgi:hypothetical protein
MDYSKIDLKGLACLIYETLKSNGIEAVLVGGACVSIYSQNRYQSFDLDFVTYEELKSIEKALENSDLKELAVAFPMKIVRILSILSILRSQSAMNQFVILKH